MTSTTVRFDLRSLIREVCAGSPSNSFPELAGMVSARIDDADLREALDQVLPSLVQREVHRNRQETAHIPKAPEPVVPDQTQPIPEQRNGKPVGWSWSVAGIQLYADKLNQRYATDFGPDKIKNLGQFTIDDCRTAFAMHTKLSEGNRRAAKRYSVYIGVLQKYGCATIADLPDFVLAQLFGGVR